MKFAYVHIPKTGGNYVQWALSHINLLNLGHSGFHHLTGKVNDENYNKTCYDFDLSDTFIFTTIRNPFSLLVSWYTHTNGGQNGLDNCNSRYGFKSFNDFIHKFCDLDFEWHRPKMREFLFWQIFDNDVLMVDSVIKLENIDEELNKIFSKYNIIPKIGPKINNSTSSDYKTFYTPETKRMVENKCAKELELFNYDLI